MSGVSLISLSLRIEEVLSMIFMVTSALSVLYYVLTGRSQATAYAFAIVAALFGIYFKL